jgi:transketolase N-terminal domain/subunit
MLGSHGVDLTLWFYEGKKPVRVYSEAHHINPKWEGRDKLLMSKGHAAIIQYAALAELGYFPTEELVTLKKLGSMLQGHPDIHKRRGSRPTRFWPFQAP